MADEQRTFVQKMIADIMQAIIANDGDPVQFALQVSGKMWMWAIELVEGETIIGREQLLNGSSFVDYVDRINPHFVERYRFAANLTESRTLKFPSIGLPQGEREE